MAFLITGLGQYSNLAHEICEIFPAHRAEWLTVLSENFPDGERYHRVASQVMQRDVVIVSGTPDDATFLDLIDVSWTCARNGARSLLLVVPYLGYSTMEREGKMPGESVKAEIRVKLLSAIPHPFVSILFLDLHADGIPYYSDGMTRGFHKHAEEVILRQIHALTDGDSFAIGSTDGGRSKWVQVLADKCHVPTLVCLKTRESGTHTTLKDIQGDANGLRVVIYDDMIRTGGSLIQAAKGYLAQGATRVDAVATHGVLPGNSAATILQSGFIDSISVTDSLPCVYKILERLPSDIQSRFQIVPIASLLAGHINQMLPGTAN